jgi:hypothetical protein
MRLEKIRTLYLADGEHEVLCTRRHIAAVLSPFLVAAGIAVVASRLYASSPKQEDSNLDDLLAWIVAIFVIRFLFKLLEWWYDLIFVTDRRIFEVRGLVPQHIYSMPLWKVTDMTYRRTAWGFLFGYGALILETAGQDQALDYINYLPDPDSFYKAINSQGQTFEEPHGGGEEQPIAGGDDGASGGDRYDTPPFPFRLG